MVLETVYQKGDTLLIYDQHPAKQTKEIKISHLSKIISEQDQIVFKQKLFICK